MKKLILLLLFIPLVSFGQTFQEFMTINSLDKFKRVVIENNYEFVKNFENGNNAYSSYKGAAIYAPNGVCLYFCLRF